MHVKNMLAALTALALTAVTAVGQSSNFGPPLPVTNITVNGDSTISLKWDDYSDIVGFQLLTTLSLEMPNWQPMKDVQTGLTRMGADETVFSLTNTVVTVPGDSPTSKQFYRLVSIKGKHDCVAIVTVGEGEGKVHYIQIGKDPDVYIEVDGEGNAKKPLTYWKDIHGTPRTQVWPDGQDGWTTDGPDSGCTCVNCPCGGSFTGGTTSGKDTDGDYVFVPGPDGKAGTDDDVFIRPATKADVDPETGIVTVPEGSVISTNGAPVIIEPYSVDGTYPEGTLVLPDGTIIIPGTGNYPTTPKINPDGTVDVDDGDVIVRWPYDKPYIVTGPGTYDPTVPGVVYDDGDYVSVPGPDGKAGTDDDVFIRPATKADVDPETGIVTVPEGSVISTNDAPVIIEPYSVDGTYPEGTLVLPDGTIIIPGTGNYPTTPKINPDGTVDVDDGDIIILPPYDNPYVVDGPGTYDPTIPGVVYDDGRTVTFPIPESAWTLGTGDDDLGTFTVGTDVGAITLPSPEPNEANWKYEIVDGTLPPGLSLAPDTGEITGTPNTAGTYTFRVKATPDNGGDPVSEEFIIVIAKAGQAALTVDDPGAKTFGGAAFQLSTTGGSGTGAVTYTLVSGNGGTVTSGGWVTITNAGTIVVSATKAGDANYNAQNSVNRTITIGKANPVVTWPTGLTATEGQTLANVSLPGNGSSIPAGTFTWTAGNGTSVGTAGNNLFNVTFTPTDTANYNTVYQDVTVVVSAPPANGLTVADITAANFKLVARADANGTITGWNTNPVNAPLSVAGATYMLIVSAQSVGGGLGPAAFDNVQNQCDSWFADSTCPSAVRVNAVVPVIPPGIVSGTLTAANHEQFGISYPTAVAAAPNGKNVAFAMSVGEIWKWGNYQYSTNIATPGFNPVHTSNNNWTRSEYSSTTAYLHYNTGTLNGNGIGKANTHGVRPALWVKVAP